MLVLVASTVPLSLTDRCHATTSIQTHSSTQLIWSLSFFFRSSGWFSPTENFCQYQAKLQQGNRRFLSSHLRSRSIGAASDSVSLFTTTCHFTHKMAEKATICFTSLSTFTIKFFNCDRLAAVREADRVFLLISALRPRTDNKAESWV